MSKRDFIGIDHGAHHIDLTHLQILGEFKPTEVHFKENGAEGDNPSLAIVMATPITGGFVFGQISVEMFNEGLADIGWELKQK